MLPIENNFLSSDQHIPAYSNIAHYCWDNSTIWQVQNRIVGRSVSHNNAGHVHNVSKYIGGSCQNRLSKDDWLLASVLSVDAFCNLFDWNLLAASEKGQKHPGNYQGLDNN